MGEINSKPTPQPQSKTLASRRTSTPRRISFDDEIDNILGLCHLLMALDALEGENNQTTSVPKKTGQTSTASKEEEKSTSLPQGVSRTKEMDIISWDDDPSTDRFKMPCGHAIGADTLKSYTDAEIGTGNFEIRCPKCKQNWKLSTIRDILKVSSLEYEYLSNMITEHSLFMSVSSQSCPECKTPGARDDQRNPRVICPVCSKDGIKFEFCWYCLGKWNSKDTKNCGNQECPGEDPALKELRECEVTNMDFSNVSCPSIRACPSCFMLIEHNKRCKTMTCNGCRQIFCFVCLKKANSEWNLPCGSYRTPCKVAPRQQHLFKLTE